MHVFMIKHFKKRNACIFCPGSKNYRDRTVTDLSACFFVRFGSNHGVVLCLAVADRYSFKIQDMNRG